MDQVTSQILAFLTDRIGAEGILVILLAGALIYIWYQRGRARILEERISLKEERRESVAEELRRVTSSLAKESDLAEAYSIRATDAGAHEIIIAEDDSMLRLAFAEVLQGIFQDARIVTAQDGERCLELVRDRRPSVLLLDLAMPKKSGWEVIDELSRQGEQFPLIVITAANRGEVGIHDIAPSYKGPKMLLQKPVASMEIALAINDLSPQLIPKRRA